MGVAAGVDRLAAVSRLLRCSYRCIKLPLAGKGYKVKPFCLLALSCIVVLQDVCIFWHLGKLPSLKFSLTQSEECCVHQGAGEWQHIITCCVRGVVL